MRNVVKFIRCAYAWENSFDAKCTIYSLLPWEYMLRIHINHDKKKDYKKIYGFLPITLFAVVGVVLSVHIPVQG